MPRNKPLVLLGAIVTLAVAAAVLVLVDGRAQAGRAARAEEFQQLVGGLGLGPAVDLGRCPNSFDPRLGHHCPADLGPIPGGGWFCPDHACSVLYYPPLKGTADRPAG